MPVAKWGRAFLERGWIEARFVKPVYDGDTTELRGELRDGVLSIKIRSRGLLCANGTASLPASAPVVSISDFNEVKAVAERKPVNKSWSAASASGSAASGAPGPAKRRGEI